MKQDKNKSSMKGIYVWGFPINLSLELSIQFLSLIIPVYIILKSINTKNIIVISLAILISLYIYPFSILLLSALITRLLPKPKLGNLKNSIDVLKFQTLIALNTFVRRTPARWLIIFPFPGYLFYKLSGTKIAPSALVTSPDSLQDVYLISIGEKSLLGWGCLVLGHYSGDGITTQIGKVLIGDNVLIGENATIWPNVKIGDRSIIQNKSVVMPGTIIPPNEIWGGVPAKKIRSIEKKKNSTQIVSLEPEKIEKYIRELLANNYNVESVDKNADLLSLGLAAEDINRILKTLEKKYDIFIDRTEINITTFSFNNLLKTIQK